MRYVFIMLTVLWFMLLWMFFFIDDTYHAGLSALACAMSAFIVTTCHE